MCASTYYLKVYRLQFLNLYNETKVTESPLQNDHLRRVTDSKILHLWNAIERIECKRGSFRDTPIRNSTR